MTNEIKEIYLSNLEWSKTHDNDIKVNDDMGGVMGNIVFKDNMPYEEFQKLFKNGYFILCDKDYITNLQEENKRLKEDNYLLIDYQDMEIRYNDYKQRIDIAIEYIEENTTKEYQVPLIDSFSISYQKLVDILRGDE